MSTTAPIIRRRCGDRGWLIDVPAATAAQWARALTAQPWAQQLLEDVVPSDTSVLVTARPGVDMYDVYLRLGSAPADVATGFDPISNVSQGSALTIPVRYDGCDLSDVAHRLGLTERQVVELHTSTTYTVSFFGFAPGFAYLRGLADALYLPRRANPRTRVDAGSVAIAGSYSVVYPGHTPGGWHIVGSTPEQFWDVDADPPNRFDVGDVVRFVDSS